MANFEKDAKALLEHIGGSDNINAATHCATRMRFALKDQVKRIFKQLRLYHL